MNVLITGGAGMLGTHLARRLAAEPGRTVTTVDIAPVPGADRHLTADIRDPAALDAAMTGADVVVHAAAALPSHRGGEIRSVDVDGTRAVLDAALRHGVRRVVHVSSTAVYGLPTLLPTPEDAPLTPIDAYNTAKIEAEAVCGEFRARGLCVPILRPKTFLGPQRLGIFAMLFEWAVEGRNFPLLGGGRVRCQMLDVDDLCDAVIAAMDGDGAVVNDTFNIAATEFGTLREDFQAILDAAGHGRRVVSVPGRPAVAVLRGLELVHASPVYGRLAHKLLADSYVATDRAATALGYRPRYSNTASLLRTFEWYRRCGIGAAAGRTHRDPWRQGALRLAKAIF